MSSTQRSPRGRHWIKNLDVRSVGARAHGRQISIQITLRAISRLRSPPRRALGNGNERRRSFPLSGEEYKLCFGEMQPDIMAAIITALINFTREREGEREGQWRGGQRIGDRERGEIYCDGFVHANLFSENWPLKRCGARGDGVSASPSSSWDRWE